MPQSNQIGASRKQPSSPSVPSAKATSPVDQLTTAMANLSKDPEDTKADRVNNLLKVLEDIKADVKTRRFILDHCLRDGRYCQSCSPLQKVGHCGPTCPLLRPTELLDNRSGTFFIVPEAWGRETITQHQTYKAMKGNLKRAGHDVDLYELEKWECVAEDMREEGLSFNEQWNFEKDGKVRLTFKEVNWEGNGGGKAEDNREPVSPLTSL
jgi:hypothetical protein